MTHTDSDTTQIIDVSTANGPIKIEVRSTGREKVAFTNTSINTFISSISTIASEVKGALDVINPSHATVEFGVEAVIEAGGLIAVLAKGSTKANLKITLSW